MVCYETSGVTSLGAHEMKQLASLLKQFYSHSLTEEFQCSQLSKHN